MKTIIGYIGLVIVPVSFFLFKVIQLAQLIPAR